MTINYNKIMHLVASVVCFAIPIMLSMHSGVETITVGAILNAVYLYCSQLLNPTQPVSK